MSSRQPFTEDLIVTFVRIGADSNVPELRVPAGTAEAVREQIHAFVAERLGISRFTIQLWPDHGFIDLGTHSAGSFTIRPASAAPSESDGKPPVSGSGG